MKQCFKCGATKPLGEFHRHPRMADGHLGKCKYCANADVRDNRRTNIEYYREYEKRRFASPARKAQVHDYVVRRRARYPEKYKAVSAVNNAIRDGRLVRQPCEVCGDVKSQAHHEDHAQPFKIRWLCFRHHRELHGQVVA